MFSYPRGSYHSKNLSNEDFSPAYPGWIIVKTVKSCSSDANSSKSSNPSIQTLHQDVQNFKYTFTPESAISSKETIFPSKSGNSKGGAVSESEHAAKKIVKNKIIINALFCDKNRLIGVRPFKMTQ